MSKISTHHEATYEVLTSRRDQIEMRLSEIDGEIEDLESERMRLVTEFDKIEKQINETPVLAAQAEEQALAKAEQRRQNKLLKQRYGGAGYPSRITDYWNRPVEGYGQ